MKIETYEQALVLAAKNKNETAFKELYKIYYPGIHQKILSRVGDPKTAEALLRETFSDVWNRIYELEDPDSFGAWTQKIAEEQCLKSVKTRETPDVEGSLVATEPTILPEQKAMELLKTALHPSGSPGTMSPKIPISQQANHPAPGIQNVHIEIPQGQAAKAGISSPQLPNSANQIPSGMQNAVRLGMQDTGGASAGVSSTSAQPQNTNAIPEGMQDAVRSGMPDTRGASAGPSSSSQGSIPHPNGPLKSGTLSKGSQRAAQFGYNAGKTAAAKVASGAAGALGRASGLKIAAIITGAVITVSSSTAGAVSLARNVGSITSRNQMPEPQQPAAVEIFDVQESAEPETEQEVQQTPAPLESAEFPQEARDFLWQYICYFQYGGNAEYDSENAMYASSNILYEIAADNLVQLGKYPSINEETIQYYYGESDPRNWWTSEQGYQTVDGPTVDWVAEIIFHVPHDDIEDLWHLAEEGGSMYREYRQDGYLYYTPLYWGYGVQNTIDIDDAKTDGTKYYVTYSLYYDLQYFFPETDSERTYLKTFYAVLEPVTIDGTEYWTMYLNTENIPDQN